MTGADGEPVAEATTTTAPASSDTAAAAGGAKAKTKPFNKQPRYGEPELEQVFVRIMRRDEPRA